MREQRRALHLLAAGAAAALALLGGATPAGAYTRVVIRPTPVPPRYVYVPPVYVPPVDYRAPVAATLAADQALAEATRSQVAGALAANDAERLRVLAQPADEDGSAREQLAAVRDADAEAARLSAIHAALETAFAALDDRAHRAADLQASLYDRPVEDGQADAGQLDGELGGIVDGALQAVYDAARAELGDVFGAGLGAPRFSWPEQHFDISQGFGPSDLDGEPPFAGYDHFHLGLDLAAPEDTTVTAAADGVVVLVGAPTTVGRFMGFGNFVVVAHGGQVDTLYGHLHQALVKPGQVVHAGQPLGLEGSTGYSTGPHLHFETHAGGRPVDPAPYLPAR